MTRELQPGGDRRRSPTCRSPPGPFNPHSVARLSAGRRAHRLRARPEWIDARRQLDGHREHLRRSSRDAPRTASARGSRSTSPASTGRRAIACWPGIMTAFGAPTGADPDRRQRRVRRRDAGVFSQAAHRRAVHRRPAARLGRRLGHARRRRGHREQLRQRHERGDDARAARRSAPTASSRSAIRARTAARRSTRASGSPVGRWPICGTPSSSTTTRWTGCVSGDFHRLRPLRAAVRLRQHADRARASPTARRSSARPRRCVSRATAFGSTRSTSARAAARVTGAAFVGWDGDYSFNADGARIPVESLTTAALPAGAALRPAPVQRHRRGHLRRAALRRQGCASTTCSPATKASARSTAGCRCAASC